MKALSVRQPWAELIATGQKDIEYRTWKTAYRGPLVICASSSWGADQPCPASERAKYPRGVAVCLVDLVDIQESEEVDGLYEWLLEGPVRIDPVPVKGKLNLFELDPAKLIVRDNDGKPHTADEAFREIAEDEPTYSGGTIKALTVNQPFATWIDRGAKTVEVRAFSTDYRGDLLIVSGNNVIPDAMDRLEQTMNEQGVDFDEWSKEYPLNSTVCVVTLKDVVPLEQKHLKDACLDEIPQRSKPLYAWLLENPRPLEYTSFHGRLRLYDAPQELLEYVEGEEES